MGVAQLTKVTIIAPRTEYPEVVRRLAEFSEFHPLEDGESNFDPSIQELAIKAVRLFAQADQVVKELSIPLTPGMIDVIFKGIKIPQSEYRAKDWKELLDKLELELAPLFELVRREKNNLAKAIKEEEEISALIDALKFVSEFSIDLSLIKGTKRLKIILATCKTESINELKRSLPDLILFSSALSQDLSLVLIAGPASETQRMERVMKVLEIKQLSLPESLPQNPSEAFRRLKEQYERVRRDRLDIESRLLQIKESNSSSILAIRELAEVARDTLDSARVAGGLKRIAVFSGFIPSSRYKEFSLMFSRWMIYGEDVKGHMSEKVPTLMVNNGIAKPFEKITQEQGIPSGNEIDPTPVISLVFPAFFGMMFGDLGHGIILTLFAMLVRHRGKGSLRQWGNIFLSAGISTIIFGILFGEFFGFPLSSFLPIQTAIEIVVRPPLVNQATLSPEGTAILIIISILIGIAHITTGLVLDILEAVKIGEKIELIVEKIPSLVMYLSGIGFGLAFIGAGYSFNVFKSSNPVPLIGLPTSLVGTVSVITVIASMLTIAMGRGIAVSLGRISGESTGEAFANGAIEVFEKISQFLANTISYSRLAILLFVHAALLLTINLLANYPIYISALPIAILNILIVILEGLIVYVQDLRLHIYEFFTKFYEGSGTPFKKIFPERARIKVQWLS